MDEALDCESTKAGETPKAEPKAPKRAKRECPLCHGIYLKLTDHLNKTHQLKTWKERKPYME